MQPAHHGACTQLASPLRHLPAEAVEAAAVAPIHALAETAVVGVAVVVGVVRGVGVACGFLVSAVHGVSSLPFDTHIIAEKCYKTITKVLQNS